MAAEQSSSYKRRRVSKETWLRQETAIRNIVQTAIDNGGPAPNYGNIAEEVGVSRTRVGQTVKTGGYQEALNELRGGPQIASQNARIEFILWEAVNNGGPVPVYSAVSEEVGVPRVRVERLVVRKPKLQHALQELREEQAVLIPEKMFPKTQETAWFLGMLMGTGGSVDMSRGVLAFSSREEDTYKLHAFKMSGEFVLGQWEPNYDRPDILGTEIQKSGNTHPSLVFNSKPHIRALGPFTKDERGDTIKQRHDWVETPQFIESYVSGIFDSGGKIRRDGKRIDFNTSSERLANYYIDLFRKLDIASARKEYQKSKGERRLRCVTIGKKADIKKLVSIITSVNPEIQAELDDLKI